MELYLIFQKIFLLLVLFIFILSGYASASNKKILALYKSNEHTTAKDNPILHHLSQQLKELGYEVDYKDSLGKLPDSEEMKEYEGIITFYFTPVHPKAKEYIKWLKEEIKAGRKIIIFGNFGAHSIDGSTWLDDDVNSFFLLFGLAFYGTEQIKSDDLEILHKDNSVITSLHSSFPEYFLKFASVNQNNRDYLRLSLKNQKDCESSLVVKTPFGGMAQIGYIYSTEVDTGKITWHLNRDNFLKDVLTYKISEKPVTKILLALYKSSENQSSTDNLIRRFASATLFKLGYQIDYYDIEKEFPSEAVMNKYTGIITWFSDSSMYKAADYCQWLSDQIMNQKKVIILGNFGAYSEKIKSDTKEFIRFLEERELNNFFYPFGLKMEQQWTDDPNLIRCEYVDKDILIEELLKKPEDLRNYFTFKSILPVNRPYMTLSRTDLTDSKSDVIVSTPYGGMALESYIYTEKDNQIKFILKLDKFFSECLKEREFASPEDYIINVDTDKELNRALKETKEMEIPSPCSDGIKRKILVLYKGSECSADKTPFYMYGDVILNYLGMVCDYVDIEAIKPDDNTMENYLGIITWFISSGMKNADDYNRWLLRQINTGKKIVLLYNYGALYNSENYKYSNLSGEVFQKLGLEFNHEYFSIKNGMDNVKKQILTARHNTGFFGFQDFDFTLGRTDVYGNFYYSGKIIDKEQDLFDFEEALELKTSTGVTPVRSIDDKNKILLKIYSTETGEITPAVTGKWGGILLGEFFYREKEEKLLKSYEEIFAFGPSKSMRDRGRWIINPFKFFSEALELNNLPRPDYTTLNGQRIFYSHIDGDGLLNLSEIEKKKYAGEIILEKILKKYNLPLSVSVITKEMTEFGSKYYNPAVKLARHIFALDNIEVASHTHTHPFDLVQGNLKFEKKDNSYKLSQGKPSSAEEILYSTALINQNLVTEEKKTASIFWSGECNPPEEFLMVAEKLGLTNINGGDPLYDETHKSYSNLCPVLASAGSKIQVHTSGSNDYIYTDSWTGNYNGMLKLKEHIEYTDSPVRISPINIYYHFYSGVYNESLNALHTLYDYCLTKHIAPLFASQYSLIVNDFYHTQIGKTTDGGYIIRNMGSLRTVRFDNTGLYGDLEKSENILGFDYYNNSLYIFLDEKKEHKIYLSEKPQTRPYLKSASHYIDSWVCHEKHIKASLKGLGSGYMEIANLMSESSYQITLGDMKQTVYTSKEGLLAFSYELEGKPRLYELEIEIK